MMSSDLIPLLIATPMAAGVLTTLLRGWIPAQRFVGAVSLAVTIIMAAYWMIQTQHTPILVTQAGGWRAPAANGDSTEFINETKRFFLTLALCVGYAAGLVGQLPFWAATFLFVFGFISLFEWRSDSSRARRAGALALAALQAAIVAAAVTYVFEQIFLVRLP